MLAQQQKQDWQAAHLQEDGGILQNGTAFDESLARVRSQQSFTCNILASLLPAACLLASSIIPLRVLKHLPVCIKTWPALKTQLRLLGSRRHLVSCNVFCGI